MHASLSMQVVSEWDAEFVNVDQEVLFELILVINTLACMDNMHLSIQIQAANYLDIKPLLDLTCAKVASMIKVRICGERGRQMSSACIDGKMTMDYVLQGKTPEEIRKQFNIVNDFTPEEEAQVGFCGV